MDDLDTAIELQDLRLAVMTGQKLDAQRYRRLIESMQSNRESRAKAAAAERRSARKTLSVPQQKIDLSTLF